MVACQVARPAPAALCELKASRWERARPVGFPAAIRQPLQGELRARRQLRPMRSIDLGRRLAVGCDAQALVGWSAKPMSVAGVARRHTRRAVHGTAAVGAAAAAGVHGYSGSPSFGHGYVCHRRGWEAASLPVRRAGNGQGGGETASTPRPTRIEARRILFKSRITCRLIALARWRAAPGRRRAIVSVPARPTDQAGRSCPRQECSRRSDRPR